MASKRVKKSKQSMIAAAACALLGLVAILMMFGTGIKLTGSYEGSAQSTFSGWNIIFGYTLKSEGFVSVSTKYFGFNFVAFLSVLLTLGGMITLFVKSGNILLRLLPVVLFAVATVLFFMFATLAPIAAVDGSVLSFKKLITSDLVTIQLGWGAIVAGVLTAIATLGSAYKGFLMK